MLTLRRAAARAGTISCVMLHLETCDFIRTSGVANRTVLYSVVLYFCTKR